MIVVWPVLLVVLRALYLLYSLWCRLFPLAAALALYACWQGAPWLGLDGAEWRGAGGLALAALALFGLWLLVGVYRRRTPGDSNPFQSAFLSWFGTLRMFHNRQAADMVKVALPSRFLVENPAAYRIAGGQLADIQNLIRPGDILLRAYDGYVDGFMIRHASVCSSKGFHPGWFTHAALYVGPLTEQDRALVPSDFQNQDAYFQTGATQVIHSMAMGVHTQDLLTFCRCDYLCILRLRPQAGLDVAAAIDAAKAAALGKIGEKYDFDSSDVAQVHDFTKPTAFHRFSCSELVFYCYRAIHATLGLKPQIHALYPLSPLNQSFHLLARNTIVPDDYFALVRSGALTCEWQDPLSQQFHDQGAA